MGKAPKDKPFKAQNYYFVDISLTTIKYNT